MKAATILLSLTATILLGTLPAHGQDQAAINERLREALRNTTLQLRTAQTDLEVAKAEQEVLVEQVEDLEARIEKLAKQSAAEQAALKENIVNLNQQLDRKDAEAERLADALLQWKGAYEKIREHARDSVKKQQQLEAQLADTKRLVELRETQNRDLYRTGVEILERYENFGLGTAITAREPFTRITRVKLQNLVQDYADRLDDSRITMKRESLNPVEENDDAAVQ